MAFWSLVQVDKLQKSASLVKFLEILVSLPSLVSSAFTNCISGRSEKRKGTSDDIQPLGKGLFVKAFYKYSSYSDVFNTIKGATRLIYLFLVIGIGVLGLSDKLIARAIRLCKYYNMPFLYIYYLLSAGLFSISIIYNLTISQFYLSAISFAYQPL